MRATRTALIAVMGLGAAGWTAAIVAASAAAVLVYPLAGLLGALGAATLMAAAVTAGCDLAIKRLLPRTHAAITARG